MVDNEQEVTYPDKVATEGTTAYGIFIKIDFGSHRAGVLVGSSSLRSLIDKAEESAAINSVGFYCYAGLFVRCTFYHQGRKEAVR